MSQSLLRSFDRGARRLSQFYPHISLRSKFALLIGFIIFVVVLLLSMAVLEAEKHALRQKVEEICKLSVQSLSSVAKDNLLIQNYAPIQDVIKNMVQLDLEGFESAFVLNREALVVAHSDPSRLYQENNGYVNYLSSKDTLRVIEHEQRSQYIQTITVNAERNGGSELVNIGLVEVNYSHEMIRSALGESKKVVFWITAGVLVLSFFLVNVSSKKLSSDIVTLSKGVRELGEGNLNVNIDIRKRDEIGVLAEEFNKMVRSLRENIQMQKFVSSLTVDMIKSQAEEGGTTPTVVKQEIAVLFSDIRGFSSLSESLEPERLVEVVNVYLDLQSHQIVDNGGVIDKFAGDLIMAIFQGMQAPDKALKAAINIQKGLIEVNQRRRKAKKECLSVGIGINYGEAILSSMGAASRKDYTAVGDVVNLASKLCNFARSGHIVVTKNVIRNLRASYSVIKMEPVSLSGRKKLVPIYRVSY